MQPADGNVLVKNEDDVCPFTIHPGRESAMLDRERPTQ